MIFLGTCLLVWVLRNKPALHVTTNKPLPKLTKKIMIPKLKIRDEKGDITTHTQEISRIRIYYKNLYSTKLEKSKGNK